MASTRLPGKPLADIGGKPMIVHVADLARQSDCGDVLVATDSNEVLSAVQAAGHRAALTRTDHETGSDRIFEALESIGSDHDTIINVQGDLPTLDPDIIRNALMLMNNPDCDIATLGTEIIDETEKSNPNVVKIVVTPMGKEVMRALYFTRATAPYGDGPLYHHIGLYVYRRASLERFVNAHPSTLERREKLEQLRALEMGMQIHVSLVDTVPLGVDTPPDLEKARRLIEHANGN